jgi:hypothetical protein
MGSQFCSVEAMVGECVIHRETTGCYVVSRRDQPLNRVRAATLAGAYAVCRGLERLHPSAPNAARRGTLARVA